MSKLSIYHYLKLAYYYKTSILSFKKETLMTPSNTSEWQTIMAQSFWPRKHYKTHVRTERTAHADEALPACKGFEALSLSLSLEGAADRHYFWLGVQPLIRSVSCLLPPAAKAFREYRTG